MTFECGSMMSQGNAPVEYSPAIQRLLSEHGPLREQMTQYYKLGNDIKNSTEGDLEEQIKDFHGKVVKFISELDPHSKREEDFLFTAMGKYIGRTSGPLVVMEYEHDQAKKNLALFIENYEKLSSPPSRESVSELIDYAIEAYYILTDHFMKEENVLFPMAERVLSDEEKEELVVKFNEI